jgi:hypothetical protein
VRDLAAADDGSVWLWIETPGHGGGLQHVVDGVMQPFAVPKLNGETRFDTQTRREAKSRYATTRMS